MSNTVLVIGKIEHYGNLLDYMGNQTNQYICYVSDQPPDERWLKIKRKYQYAVYFECDLRNIEELARTAINFAAHTILLTWLDKTSVPDSEIISIARIIEENFTSNFTIELVEEANMKY